MILKEFKADLHIHTCLSPCADLTMLPTAIVKQAKLQNLDIVGICDHNSAENVTAVKKAGEREGLQVLGGLEITSREEVHTLAFFDDDTTLREMQNIIYKNLSGENDEDFFGEQVIVDEYDRPIDLNSKLLIGATSLPVDEIVKLIHGLGGLAIASHIDRESFSIIGQLGFIPEQLPLDALELSPNYESSKIANYESYGFPLVTSSDAHFLSDIGKNITTFFLNAPSFSEVAMAIHGIEGRKVGGRLKTQDPRLKS
jgi:PHP family Zn ribbon phosphoesterase